jgi:hypothetical protein
MAKRYSCNTAIVVNPNPKSIAKTMLLSSKASPSKLHLMISGSILQANSYWQLIFPLIKTNVQKDLLI